MIQMKFVIRNPAGLHTRPASAIAQTAGRFASRITLEYSGGKSCNAKSVLHLAAAGIRWGDAVYLAASGPDEAEALEALGQVLEEWLGCW